MVFLGLWLGLSIASPVPIPRLDDTIYGGCGPGGNPGRGGTGGRGVAFGGMTQSGGMITIGGFAP